MLANASKRGGSTGVPTQRQGTSVSLGCHQKLAQGLQGFIVRLCLARWETKWWWYGDFMGHMVVDKDG